MIILHSIYVLRTCLVYTHTLDSLRYLVRRMAFGVAGTTTFPCTGTTNYWPTGRSSKIPAAAIGMSVKIFSSTWD